MCGGLRRTCRRAIGAEASGRVGGAPDDARKSGHGSRTQTPLKASRLQVDASAIRLSECTDDEKMGCATPESISQASDSGPLPREAASAANISTSTVRLYTTSLSDAQQASQRCYITPPPSQHAPVISVAPDAIFTDLSPQRPSTVLEPPSAYMLLGLPCMVLL